MNMSSRTGDFSRRTFLLGVGGGAASMSIVWGVSSLKLPLLGLGDESPIAATLDAHAEYDRWLVTTEDKERMVLIVDYDARADLFADIPRTITISIGDQVARSFVPDGAGRQQTNVLLAAEMLGGRNRLEVHIAVDRLFGPANVSAGSQDTRELGI